MKDAIVCNGAFRVFEDGRIHRIKNGFEFPAKTYRVGRNNSESKYLVVSYTENGQQHHAYVHRLIAEAFIPNPLNKKEVNHKDGNKSNNAVSNLEWVSRVENCRHAYANGLIVAMRNATPCIFCGTPTRSKSGCCTSCLNKAKVAVKKSIKQTVQAERYVLADILPLTDNQSQFVEYAKAGMSNTEIAREMGLSRQRIDQIAKRVEQKMSEAIM